jgi:hypothetical protein
MIAKIIVYYKFVKIRDEGKNQHEFASSVERLYFIMIWPFPLFCRVGNSGKFGRF